MAATVLLKHMRPIKICAHGCQTGVRWEPPLPPRSPDCKPGRLFNKGTDISIFPALCVMTSAGTGQLTRILSQIQDKKQNKTLIKP
jgi:hypothetical protein